MSYGHGFQQGAYAPYRTERTLRGMGRGNSHSLLSSSYVSTPGPSAHSDFIPQATLDHHVYSIHTSNASSSNSRSPACASSEASGALAFGPPVLDVRVEAPVRRPRRFRSIADLQHDDQALVISRDPCAPTTGLQMLYICFVLVLYLVSHFCIFIMSLFVLF